MKESKKLFALLIIILPALLGALANYKSLSTPYFKVFYRPGWDTEALNLLQAMEYSRPFVEELTGNHLDQVPFVIEDMGNIVNGYTNPVGNKIAVFAYPPSGDVLSNGEDWWQMVGMHEYIHMSQLTKVSGEPAIVRALFGNIFYPNLYQPNWMSEAITVYGESAISKYSGRMNGGTYPAIISSLSRAGKMPSLVKAGYNSYDTPLANHYVFGGSFYQYLADTYGKDRFSILYEHTGSSLFSYLNPLYSNLSLDKAYQAAFGKPLQNLWYDWQAQERSKDLRFPSQRITKRGWNISDLRYHDGALYYITYSRDKTGPFSSFGSHQIIRLSNPQAGGREELIVDQATEFPAGYQIQGSNLYYSRQEMVKGYDNNEYDGLGVISEIWKKSLYGGGAERMLQGPIRSFLVRKDGSFLVSMDDKTHQNSLIYSFDASGKNKTLIASVNQLIGSIHEYEGKTYVTARSFMKNNSIFELDLDTKKIRPLIDSPYGESILDISGGKIYYEAVYEGKNGCYSYDLQSREIYRLGDYTEMRNLVPASDGSFYFVSMNEQGQDIYKEQLRSSHYQLPAEKHPTPYTRLDIKKDDVVLDKYPVQRGGYLANIGHMLWPRLYRFPYIAGTEDSLSLGLQVAGSDILGDFPYWGAAVIWDSNTNDIGYQLELQNNLFRPISQTLSYSSFEGGKFDANQSISLYSKMNYGITDIWTGFGLTTSQGMERKLWYPYLGTGFRWKGASLSLVNQFMYETKEFWPSDRERMGWQARASLKQKLGKKMELRSKAHLAWDPDAGSGEVFSNIRGYDENWNHNKGLSLQNAIYMPLIRIREGLWNPNVYLEDINAGIFFDAAIPEDGSQMQTRWSGGIELIAELYAAYSYNLGLGVRLSYNKDKQIKPALILGTSF